MPITSPGNRPERRPLSHVVLFGLLLSLLVPLTASAHARGEASDFEDAGVIGDGEYESPQFGYSVEWPSDWDLDFEYDPPVESDEDAERGNLKLAWTGEDGQQAYANVIGGPADYTTVEDEFALMTDPETVASIWGADVDPVVLLDDLGRDSGAVLFALVESDDDNQPSEADLDVYISLFTVVQLDDAFLYLTLSGDVADFAAAYEAAGEILVEGDELLTSFRASAIEDAMEEAMDLASPDAATDSDLEDLGLANDGEYESPQFGYSVEWSSEWGLDEYYAVPLVSDTDAGIDQLYLAWRGEQTDPIETTYVMVSGQEDGDGVDDTLELWTSEEHAEDTWGGDAIAEVILDEATGDTGVVVYSLVREDNGQQYYKVMVVVERGGGEVLNLTLNTYEPDFEVAWEAAEEILVDGKPLLTAVSWDDIEDAIEDAA